MTDDEPQVPSLVIGAWSLVVVSPLLARLEHQQIRHRLIAHGRWPHSDREFERAGSALIATSRGGRGSRGAGWITRASPKGGTLGCVGHVAGSRKVDVVTLRRRKGLGP